MKIRSGICAFLMVALASSAWPLLTTVYVAPDPSLAWWLLGAAALLALAASLGGYGRERFDMHYLVALPLVAAAAWILPWPLSLGAVVLSVALVLGVVPRFFPRWKNPVVGLALLGVVLLLQGLVLDPTLGAMSRWHVVPYLSTAASALLNFLGASAAAATDSLTVATVRENYRFPMSVELLGFPSVLLALVGGLIVTLSLVEPRHRLRAGVLVLASWVLYVPLRAVLMLLVFLQLQLYVDYFSETVRVDVLWSPWWGLAGCVPLAFLWAAVCRTGAREEERQSALASYRPLRDTLGLVGAAVGVGLIVLAVFHHDVGAPKTKRVVIDERYSDWEKSTRAPGTAWYGTLSMYNMFSLADYLAYYYELERNTEPLTDERLAKVDVLILKTPTKPYPLEEIKAVVDFVRRGGGLFMIGEHTNYVGIAVYLNSIGRRLDLHLREDCVFNLAGTDPYVEVWERPKLLYHPTVAHVPRFRFEVSCSVTSDSPETDPVMLSTGLFQLYADYFMENYYPYPRRTSSMHFGPFVQFAARDFGKGRVAVFTDSTTMSNFSAFYPGRAELVLATVDWLGRSHSDGSWRWIVAGLGALLVLGAVTFLARRGDRVGALVLLAAALSFGCAAALAGERASVLRSFPLPTPRVKPVEVAFLREHCDYELPVTDFVRDAERSFDLFYQWVLRLRYFPRVRETLDNPLDEDLLVIINPVTAFSAQELQRIRAYVEKGGKVLVLLRGASDRAAAASLLDPFALRVEPGSTPPGKPLLAADGTPTGIVTDGVVVSGGQVLYRIDGLPVAAVSTLGRGKVVVAGFGDCFSNSVMGYTNATLPDASLTARFRLEFRLLQFLLPPERLPENVHREVEADTAWMR